MTRRRERAVASRRDRRGHGAAGRPAVSARPRLRHHRRRHDGRRRRLVRRRSAANSACCRRATCATAWSRWPRTRPSFVASVPVPLPARGGARRARARQPDHRGARRHRAAASLRRSRPRAALLGTRGRVLPSTLADVRAPRRGPRRAARLGPGEHRVRAPHAVAHVTLEPDDPPAYAPALEAIAAADVDRDRSGQPVHEHHPELPGRGRGASARESSRRGASTSATSRTIAARRAASTRPITCEALVDHGLGGALDVVIVHATTAVHLRRRAR